LPFKGRYSDFAAAAAAAASLGYEDPLVVSSTVDRTRELVADLKAAPEFVGDAWTLQNLAALWYCTGDSRRRSLSVLDFGGAMGAQYFRLRPWLGTQTRISWTVCETAATAMAGARHFENSELKFISSLEECAPAYDVVFSSGALQYTDEPGRYLARLAGLAESLVINRIPFVDGSDFVSVQSVRVRGGFVSYPAWFFGESAFLDRLARAGLSVPIRWLAPGDAAVLPGASVVYQGLVARRHGELGSV
jgi:putative methyltransferase (TIGR04325 family)